VPVVIVIAVAIAIAIVIAIVIENVHVQDIHHSSSQAKVEKGLQEFHLQQ